MSEKQHKKKKKKKDRSSREVTDEFVAAEPIEFADAPVKTPADPQYPVGEDFALVSGRNIMSDEDAADHEIWMIQVPLDFDVRKLNDQFVLLEGEQDDVTSTAAPGAGSSAELNQYRSVGARFEEGQKSVCNALVASDTVSGELRGLPTSGRCAGTMRILRSISTAEREQPMAEPTRAKRKPLPAGLQPRYKPFGSNEPVVVPKKYLRKALKVIHQDPNSVLSGDEVTTKPKRKKRKH